MVLLSIRIYVIMYLRPITPIMLTSGILAQLLRAFIYIGFQRFPVCGELRQALRCSVSALGKPCKYTLSQLSAIPADLNLQYLPFYSFG